MTSLEAAMWLLVEGRGKWNQQKSREIYIARFFFVGFFDRHISLLVIKTPGKVHTAQITWAECLEFILQTCFCFLIKHFAYVSALIQKRVKPPQASVHTVLWIRGRCFSDALKYIWSSAMFFLALSKASWKDCMCLGWEFNDQEKVYTDTYTPWLI